VLTGLIRSPAAAVLRAPVKIRRRLKKITNPALKAPN
jgi:hypothetical protein